MLITVLLFHIMNYSILEIVYLIDYNKYEIIDSS
jgi:hypothetical protein